MSELDLTIKPTYSDSIIEIKFNIFGDFNQDTCFRIKRNNDFVISTTDKGKNALVTAIYDNDHGSTPTTYLVRWYDTPNTTDSITYKLYVNHSNDNDHIAYINGASAQTHTWQEQGISTASAIEPVPLLKSDPYTNILIVCVAAPPEIVLETLVTLAAP